MLLLRLEQHERVVLSAQFHVDDLGDALPIATCQSASYLRITDPLSGKVVLNLRKDATHGMVIHVSDLPPVLVGMDLVIELRVPVDDCEPPVFDFGGRVRAQLVGIGE